MSRAAAFLAVSLALGCTRWQPTADAGGALVEVPFRCTESDPEAALTVQVAGGGA